MAISFNSFLSQQPEVNVVAINIIKSRTNHFTIHCLHLFSRQKFSFHAIQEAAVFDYCLPLSDYFRWLKICGLSLNAHIGLLKNVSPSPSGFRGASGVI